MNKNSTNPKIADESTETLSFEDAMSELQEIVTALENGQAPLDQSLNLVKRGRALSQACEKMLGEAELTLRQLTATPDGELVEEELEWNKEEE